LWGREAVGSRIIDLTISKKWQERWGAWGYVEGICKALTNIQLRGMYGREGGGKTGGSHCRTEH